MGIKYFAYGENMFSPQLHAIAPNAQCLGVVKIMGYKLFFHRLGSEDPSGKCNITPVKDSTCEVYGVLYDICVEERCLLDKNQGLGFSSQEITLKVFPVCDSAKQCAQESDLFALTYIAYKDNVFEDLVPFNWYKEMVISGAKEHHLPADYIHCLEQYSATPDPNVRRAKKQKKHLESILL